MTRWIFSRVSSDTGRLPLSAYDTVLRATPARLAISPMFTAAPSSNRFESEPDRRTGSREGNVGVAPDTVNPSHRTPRAVPMDHRREYCWRHTAMLGSGEPVRPSPHDRRPSPT
ncbi:hypothetical protein GCM10027075_06710 [Streptomyces heilongjiangensis]